MKIFKKYNENGEMSEMTTHCPKGSTCIRFNNGKATDVILRDQNDQMLAGLSSTIEGVVCFSKGTEIRWNGSSIYSEFDRLPPPKEFSSDFYGIGDLGKLELGAGGLFRYTVFDDNGCGIDIFGNGRVEDESGIIESEKISGKPSKISETLKSASEKGRTITLNMRPSQGDER